MMFKPRFWTLTAMVALVVAARLAAHRPNFAPITAMALFLGFALAQRWLTALRDEPAPALAQS